MVNPVFPQQNVDNVDKFAYFKAFRRFGLWKIRIGFVEIVDK